MKILLVDDDPNLIEVLSLTLGMRWPDCSISLARDGESAIWMVDTATPHLVILGTDLSDMDGFRVCQEIRYFSDVPLIIVTTRSRESESVHGLELGADDYILKPFSAYGVYSPIAGSIAPGFRCALRPRREPLPLR